MHLNNDDANGNQKRSGPEVGNGTNRISRLVGSNIESTIIETEKPLTPEDGVGGGGGITMDDAKRYCVPFGKFRGATIAEVAFTDSGILWLEYASGLYFARGLFREALRVFLNDPNVSRRLELLRLHRGC